MIFSLNYYLLILTNYALKTLDVDALGKKSPTLLTMSNLTDQIGSNKESELDQRLKMWRAELDGRTHVALTYQPLD